MNDLFELYQAVILDHNRNPRNFRPLPQATHSGTGDNPSCGDNVAVFLQLDGDRIADVSFQGSGCAISKASASVMTTKLKGQTTAEAGKIIREFHHLLTSGADPSEEISETTAFAGVHQFPARIKCATLAWHAAESALRGDATPVKTEEDSV